MKKDIKNVKAVQELTTFNSLRILEDKPMTPEERMKQ
jgi:hypothetical protein